MISTDSLFDELEKIAKTRWARELARGGAAADDIVARLPGASKGMGGKQLGEMRQALRSHGWSPQQKELRRQLNRKKSEYANMWDSKAFKAVQGESSGPARREILDKIMVEEKRHSPRWGNFASWSKPREIRTAIGRTDPHAAQRLQERRKRFTVRRDR